jgi:hypothetical protein
MHNNNNNNNNGGEPLPTTNNSKRASSGCQSTHTVVQQQQQQDHLCHDDQGREQQSAGVAAKTDIVEKPASNVGDETKGHRFPYYNSQIGFMNTSDRSKQSTASMPFESQEFQQSLGLSIPHRLQGLSISTGWFTIEVVWTAQQIGKS